MAFQAVDENAVSAWRWESALTMTLMLIVPAAALLWHLPLAHALPLLALALLACAAWLAWYPRARYRHLAWRMDDAGILIRAGVLWRTQSAVARSRIQHTDVYQGPLQRRYGIATLKLYTAGSHHAKIELPGLAHDDALALRDELQREGSGDAV